MKLAVSNIGWNQTEEKKVLTALKMSGVSGIEVAPAKIWNDPSNLSYVSINNFRKDIEKKGLTISSTQAILFNHPELLIFSEEKIREKTLQHIIKMVNLTADLGGKVIVFGSPKNRRRESVSYHEATKIARDFFLKIGDQCRKRDVFFCLEPNSKEYGADFLVTTEETVLFLNDLNHPNLKINLDSGNMAMNNENVQEAILLAKNYLEHFQVSEPYLLPLDKTNKNHQIINRSLCSIGYSKWLSIEMREADLKELIQSVKIVKKFYEV